MDMAATRQMLAILTSQSRCEASHAAAQCRWLNIVGFQHCVEYCGVFLDDDYVAFVMGLAEAPSELVI